MRPIVEMTGVHLFNEVFLDEVRIPVENLVGEENRGWDLAKVTLANERVSLSSGGALWGRGPSASDLVDLAQEHGVDDPGLRQRLVQIHIEGELLRLLRLRTVTAAIQGTQPGPEASIRKVFADEHGQRLMTLALDLAGAGGLVDDVGPFGERGRHVALRLPVRPGADHRRRHGRGPAQHHRRAGPRPPRRARLRDQIAA